jgi:hypothetical protein
MKASPDAMAVMLHDRRHGAGYSLEPVDACVYSAGDRRRSGDPGIEEPT